MHFIFPKNYNFKPKFLGFIEYSTAIIDVILGILLYYFVNTFFSDINIKIYIYITVFFPILLISIFGINKESFLIVLSYMIKYFKNPKIYLYQKY